ncbi:hypothetical protein [Consotaella aegiceratis]|uniref:hypothetical protein n=1 Tax=Consotaella aegiceratis TaxID=3097961 RepID=UPI002F3EDB5B
MLAERMRAQHGIPWFPLDALKMGLHLGAPTLAVDPEAADLGTADQIWPIVEPILDHLIFDGRDYLVEGVNLRPQTVARFIQESDQPVRACFLGYPDITIEAKALEVARHTGLPNDWLHRTGPDNVRRYIGVSRDLSRLLRFDCEALGIPFVDTGADFSAGIDAAERVLFSSRA